LIEEAEIYFCPRCVQLINLESMKSGIENLQLVLDDLEEELLRISKINYETIHLVYFGNSKQLFM
jgi:hypothetical protein